MIGSPAGGLFGPIFTPDDVLGETSAEAWVGAMLDAEAALARALAAVGVIPAGPAAVIDATARAGAASGAAGFDPAEIGRAARRDGNPVIPLVAALRAAVDPGARPYVHWGATSQDILDTAAVLVARRSGARIDVHLDRLAAACAVLADRHRTTAMPGRTLLQPAVPIPFGLKAAGWLAGVDDARAALAGALSGLAAQLGGAAGTLASLGGEGPGVAERFAVELGLPAPTLPWHSARQRITAVAGAAATVAGTAAKVATDVVLLAQGEVAEAAEAAAGGSSAMPHKRNPAASIAVIAAARRAQALLPVLFGSLIAEHERAAGAWHAEWEAWSELLALTGGAAARAADVVDGLAVDPAAMAADIARTGGAMMAERITFALAAAGADREAARAAVAAALDRSRTAPDGHGSEPGVAPFARELAAEPLVAARLDGAAIARLLDPAGYLGSSGHWIDRALAAHAAHSVDVGRPR